MSTDALFWLTTLTVSCIITGIACAYYGRHHARQSVPPPEPSTSSVHAGVHDELTWQHDNWMRLPKVTRNACLQPLHDIVKHATRERVRKLMLNGSLLRDQNFHFGVGMSIRAALRTVLRDAELPPVTYPDGSHMRSWDDYYLGALYDLVNQ